MSISSQELKISMWRDNCESVFFWLTANSSGDLYLQKPCMSLENQFYEGNEVFFNWNDKCCICIPHSVFVSAAFPVVSWLVYSMAREFFGFSIL